MAVISRLRETVAEVRSRILSVPREEFKIALACCYLFAARSCEIVGVKSPSDRTTPYGPRGEDAWLDTYNHNGAEVKAAVFRLRTAKRQGMERFVALPLDPTYEPLTERIFRYFSERRGKICFPFTRQALHSYASSSFAGIRYVIEPYGSVRQHERDAALHFLRHLRASELAQVYGITGMNLAAYGGWSLKSAGMSSSMMRYQMLSWQSYFPLLLKPSPYPLPDEGVGKAPTKFTVSAKV
jgi:hypothetical protein